jgi:hypothetical protein
MRAMRKLALAILLAAALPAAVSAYDQQAVDKVLGGEDCLDCELAGADLQGEDLGGLLAIGANLRGADLSGADLADAELDDADLRGAKLKGANLAGASFIGANLDGADLSGALLQGTEFVNASLDGTNFAGADLQGAMDADLGKAFGLPVQSAAATPAANVAPDLSDLHAGAVFLVTFDYCPKGTHEADGSAIKVKDNQILYSLFGNAYGGDLNAFNLPDLRHQVPLAGLRYCVALGGVYPARQ